jgi:hypothetical protein
MKYYCYAIIFLGKYYWRPLKMYTVARMNAVPRMNPLAHMNKMPREAGMARTIDVHTLETEPGATALLDQFKDHTDPKYVGPGIWNIIHRRAWLLRDQPMEAQKAFIEFMADVCYNFPCIVCRGHCSEYIKNHPMEEYLGVTVKTSSGTEALGLFIWTWKFHNAVNIRLRKPIMSWETAYALYSGVQEQNNLVCSKTCLESDGGSDNIVVDNNKNNLRIHRIINKNKDR